MLFHFSPKILILICALFSGGMVRADQELLKQQPLEQQELLEQQPSLEVQLPMEQQPLGKQSLGKSSLIDQEPLNQQQPSVRVLLSEIFDASDVGWELTSQEGFFITESRQSTTKIRSKGKTLHITMRDGFFYLNAKKCLKSSMFITPILGHIHFNGKSYQGSFFVTRDGARNFLINIIDLEDYVLSVLRTEGWPRWPLEMNKVLAIAIRTYVIAKVKEARESKRLYHVKNTNVHQTYTGVHNSPDLQKAVEDTKNLFLAYEGRPIIAMFDVCCGGLIPAHIRGVVDFKKAPYLERPYACTYCKDCSAFNWSVSYDKSVVLAQLRKEFPELCSLKELKITKKDKAGLVVEAVARGRHVVALTGKKIYSLFNEVLSFCFSISKKGSTIVFKGRGHGHHIGLCQWGARAMVRDGWDHKSILSFYYPNTTLMRLV